MGVGEVGVVSGDFHRPTGAAANENRKTASQIKGFLRLFGGHAPEITPVRFFRHTLR